MASTTHTRPQIAAMLIDRAIKELNLCTIHSGAPNAEQRRKDSLIELGEIAAELREIRQLQGET